VNSPQNPGIGLTVYLTDKEVSAVKRRAAALAYCQMLINFYRSLEEDNNESSRRSLGVL
jgi:hypothetical protein